MVQTITKEMSENCYNEMKDYLLKTSLVPNYSQIALKTEINESSVRIAYQILKAMINGIGFTYSYNLEGIEVFLRNIYKDFGEEFFKKACLACLAHCEYEIKKGRGTRKGVRIIVMNLTQELLDKKFI